MVCNVIEADIIIVIWVIFLALVTTCNLPEVDIINVIWVIFHVLDLLILLLLIATLTSSANGSFGRPAFLRLPTVVN